MIDIADMLTPTFINISFLLFVILAFICPVCPGIHSLKNVSLL